MDIIIGRLKLQIPNACRAEERRLRSPFLHNVWFEIRATLILYRLIQLSGNLQSGIFGPSVPPIAFQSSYLPQPPERPPHPVAGASRESVRLDWFPAPCDVTKTRNARNVRWASCHNGVARGRRRFWLTRRYGHESEDSWGLCALLLRVSQPLRHPSRESAYTTAAWTLPAPAVFVPSYTCQCVSKKKPRGVFPMSAPKQFNSGDQSTYTSPFLSLIMNRKDYPKRDYKSLPIPCRHANLQWAARACESVYPGNQHHEAILPIWVREKVRSRCVCTRATTPWSMLPRMSLRPWCYLDFWILGRNPETRTIRLVWCFGSIRMRGWRNFEMKRRRSAGEWIGRAHARPNPARRCQFRTRRWEEH